MRPGLYIQVPFCTSRCDYCAFATWSDRFDFIDEYVEALCSEIASRGAEMGNPSFGTVYLGGGTPSLLSLSQLERILAPVVGEATEVTIEANPESLPQDPATYREVGINRVSLGVQSLSDKELALLGRHHRAAEAESAIARLRDAGLRFSTDFIFGVGGGEPARMLEEIEGLVSVDAQPGHISAYGLIVEPGTPLSERPELFPDEDRAVDFYLALDRLLSRAGLGCYEISNFSRPGERSEHNWAYWMQGEYLGVGPSAHSFVSGVRSWNVRDSYRWARALTARGEATAGSERLNERQLVFEGLSLALRTSIGVPKAALDLEAIPEGLYSLTGDGRVVLTVEGRLVHSAVSLLLEEDSVSLDELRRHQELGRTLDAA